MRAPAHIAQAFADQSAACGSLGSAFMDRLMALFATSDWPEGPVTTRVFNWPGLVGPRDQSVPLRLAGALHALHLQGHPVLAPVYPPNAVSDTALWQAVCLVLGRDAAVINQILDSPPQTNEVRRSATLIAIGHWLTERFGLPLILSELGASAGLNLHWDRFALKAQETRLGPKDATLTLQPDWTGPPPPRARPEISSRAGVDLNPLSPQDDALRLQSYLWADQPDRLALTRAAIKTADTVIQKADAIDWLAPRLTHTAGQTHLIYTTVAWQYFPPDKQRQGAGLIAAAGAQATRASPLAWFGMENDGAQNGAALRLRLWPGNLDLAFGRADFHGRWVDWSPPQGV